MKKIITISMVKNEADIIETFIRYTLCFAYKMVLIDNGSTDGTLEIMNLLKKEGLNIVIYVEANSFYEQMIIENKYKKIVERTEDFDFMIPLDADEFLNVEKNDFDIFDKLPTDAVALLNWKTYCLDKPKEVKCIFEDIDLLRCDVDEYTKVIIPKSISSKALLTMGHHDVYSKDEITKYNVSQISVAHFPVREEKQLKLKLYQGVLTQLMSSYHSVVAKHWKEMFEGLESGEFDIVKYSMEYALKDNSNPNYKKENFDIEWCKNRIRNKYTKLIDRDIDRILFHFSEMIVIRNITTRDINKFRLIVYGTGETAENLFKHYGFDEYEIIAYVDSDEDKEYSTFKNTIVLAPDKIKYLDFEYVVIASKFVDEILRNLAELGVDKNKVLTSFELLNMIIQHNIE